MRTSFAGTQAGFLDRGENERDRGFVGFEVGGEATFVTDGRVESFFAANGFQAVEDFDAHAQPFAEA